MVALNHLERRRHLAGSVTHDQTAANPAAQDACDRHGHGVRRLSGAQHAHPPCRQRASGNQGTVEERGRAYAVDAGADDRQQISTKSVEPFSLWGCLWGCQWVCLGSDQAERPVTTSNFLRMELTT
jgi:hypothetical protein